MSQFNCEVCELAKHQHSVFRPCPYKNQPLLLLFIAIFGVHLVHLICLILVGLSPLLMTTLDCVDLFHKRKNLKLFPFLNNFI